MNTTSETWTPPHCPNPRCKYHRHFAPGWRFRRCGYFRRQTRPFLVPRAICLHCHRSFSAQTFRTTYWLKRPDLLLKIGDLTVGCMANRQIARALRCAPSTIDHLLARLGRHCMLFQRHHTRNASPCVDVVADGLVAFEHSQFYPFEIPAAVDNDTSFVLHFSDAPLRRSGTMTAHQKRKRERLEARFGKPDPRAVQKAMREVLEVALEGAAAAIVRTDKHQAYPRAMRGLTCRIEHRQTDSRRRRDRRNELFEINLLDLMSRHGGSRFKRETIAFAKRRQSAVEWFATHTVWKNWIKRRWEKRCRRTPAMLRGLADRILSFADVLQKRLFPSLVALPASWWRYYRREVETPVLGRTRRHRLKYAF